jgi:putative two-component system response regulator
MANRVLFVDDEINILKTVLRIFSDKRADIDILVATNAEDALDIVRSNDISVIVTDNIMPGMKGVELLSQIKDVSPDTVRIMMTGYANLNTVLDAINRCELFRFIVKPWNNDDLISIVESAMARHNLLCSIRRSDEAALLSFAQAIELKDHYTKGHCERVGRYALMLADSLCLPEEAKKQILYGSWLHDCGKIGVPEEILNKPSSLTKEEYDLLKKHPELGADIARQAQLSPTVIDIIFNHHERWDGSGYPRGIQENAIPQEAMIVSISDYLDDLTSDRCFRKGCGVSEAIDMILALQGRAFDPELVKVFASLFSKKQR